MAVARHASIVVVGGSANTLAGLTAVYSKDVSASIVIAGPMYMGQESRAAVSQRMRNQIPIYLLVEVILNFQNMNKPQSLVESILSIPFFLIGECKQFRTH